MKDIYQLLNIENYEVYYTTNTIKQANFVLKSSNRNDLIIQKFNLDKEADFNSKFIYQIIYLEEFEGKILCDEYFTTISLERANEELEEFSEKELYQVVKYPINKHRFSQEGEIPLW